MAEEGAAALSFEGGCGGMLVPQESEAASGVGSARAEMSQGAARDVMVDDGDSALRPEPAEEAFGPGGLQGARGAQQGNSEPGQGGGLGLPVVEVRGEENGGRGAALSTTKSGEVSLGSGREVGCRRAKKEGKYVPKQVKAQFPAEK